MAQRRRRPPDKSSEPDDVFVAKVFEFSTWAKQNSQMLILLGVALAGLIGGVLYYVSYRQNLSRQAVGELEAIQAAVATGDLETSKAQLSRFLERFGSTPHAGEARLLLGQMHLATGQPQQAVSALRATGVSVREPLGPQLYNLLAAAYEQTGDLQQAEQQYLTVGESAPLEFQRREALADAARVRSLQGNYAGAAEIYRRLLEAEDMTGEERGLYELRLAEVEHKAMG